MPARLLFVLAHPDDESMGNGGTIARHVQADLQLDVGVFPELGQDPALYIKEER